MRKLVLNTCKNGKRIYIREEGRIEGRINERNSIISNMLSKGFIESDVAEVCNISVDEVREYATQMPSFN